MTHIYQTQYENLLNRYADLDYLESHLRADAALLTEMQILSIIEDEPYYRDFFTLSIIICQVYLAFLPELASKEEFKPVVVTQLKALSSSKLDNKEILEFIELKKSLLETIKELGYGRESQQIEG